MEEAAGHAARRLLARLELAAKPADEESEAARDEAQRLLLARHLARLRERTESGKP